MTEPPFFSILKDKDLIYKMIIRRFGKSDITLQGTTTEVFGVLYFMYDQIKRIINDVLTTEPELSYAERTALESLLANSELECIAMDLINAKRGVAFEFQTQYHSNFDPHISDKGIDP